LQPCQANDGGAERDHVKKIIGKAYAGNRTYGLKGGWGNGPLAPRP